MITVAALFVHRGGAYWDLPGVDPWDEERDALLYRGPHPVVAHPPCNLWVNMAAVNWERYGRQKPAWYDGGNDGGCFSAALRAVASHGGVLEHPAFSHAWDYYGLTRPAGRGWSRGVLGWVCEVWQSAYGHRARKRTWLLYYSPTGNPPFELDWTRKPGTAQVGWFDRVKPTVGKKEASATPPAFRDALISLARQSRAHEEAA